VSDQRHDDSPDGMPDDHGLRELYRTLPADEPRAELDDQILAAARLGAAAGAKEPRSVVHRLRWAVPVAMAAGVVLTLTLTRLTPEQQAVNLPVAETDLRLEKHAPASPSMDSIGAADASRANAPQAQPEAELKSKEDESTSRRAPARKDEADSARINGAVMPDARDSAPTDAIVRPSKPASPPAAALAPPAATVAPGSPEPSPPAPSDAAPPADTPRVWENLRGLGYVDKPRDRGHAGIAAKRASPNEADVAAATGAVTGAEPWPFGLESGLPAGEACRRVTEAVRKPCTLSGTIADVTVEAGVIVDRGAYAGRSATRIRLLAEGNLIVGVELQLKTGNGGTESVQIRTLLH